jgi:outer membrane protein assembly factor BamD (BamD/ComL family)
LNELPTLAGPGLLGKRGALAVVFISARRRQESVNVAIVVHTETCAYLRGQIELSAHNGTAAITEFQKLLDHPGVVLNGITGALAHLQLGRAHTMQGDTVKARAAYQDFLTLWKDADPDIPILKQAKGEYAKLQ